METVLFKDLSEERQWEIVTNMMGDFWHNPLLEDIKSELEEEGFEDPEISYSGFWSQGDGASFESKNIDMEKFFDSHKNNFVFEFTGDYKEEVEDILNDIMIEKKPFLIKELIEMGFYNGKVIRTCTHYCHENTVSLSFELEGYSIVPEEDADIRSYDFTWVQGEEINKFGMYLQDYLETYIKEKSREIYRRLEKEYEDIRKEIIEEEKKNTEDYYII